MTFRFGRCCRKHGGGLPDGWFLGSGLQVNMQGENESLLSSWLVLSDSLASEWESSGGSESAGGCTCVSGCICGGNPPCGSPASTMIYFSCEEGRGK